VENSYYTFRKVVKVNLSEVYSISIKVVKHEVHIILEVKEYVIPIVCKSKLIQLSSVNKLTLIIVSYSKDIPSKFKAVKFILE